jgi:hypothetical protein
LLSPLSLSLTLYFPLIFLSAGEGKVQKETRDYAASDDAAWFVKQFPHSAFALAAPRLPSSALTAYYSERAGEQNPKRRRIQAAPPLQIVERPYNHMAVKAPENECGFVFGGFFYALRPFSGALIG